MEVYLLKLLSTVVNIPKKWEVMSYAFSVILRQVLKVMRSEMIVVPSVILPSIIDSDVSRSGGSSVLSILVYAIGCCNVIGAMG